MSHLTISQPLRPAGPTSVDFSADGRGGALRIPSPVQRELASAPRITLHFQSRASILSLSPAAQQRVRSHRTDSKRIVHPVVRFAITFFLAICAVASAAVVAFGTHPGLAQYPSGMDWITASRRLQWPLTTLSLVLCVTLIGMVVGGKRRVAWLLFLAPVLFLFYYRFAGDPFRRMAILDNPAFTPVEKATLRPESTVIGLVFEGQPYAYPTGCLALAPVIAHADADKRLLVMYSPYAGRAQAFVVDSTVKPRELDIVSMPANALLLYNSRIGQFINAFTGTTLTGERPDGFKSPIETRKTTWREWRTQYPDTKVLATTLSLAGEKLQPRFPNRPATLDLPADARVTLLATANPVALQPGKFGGIGEPLNLTTAGGAHLLIVRTKLSGKAIIFDRTVQNDLFPQFKRRTILTKPDVAFIDSDTASLWNADGRCLDGPAKGAQLQTVKVEEDVPYATLKSFYPNLELLKP